jgi:hypothetical protein
LKKEFMQTTSTSVRPGDKGFALLVTMVFLGVVLIIFASIMYWVSGNTKITERNNQYNMSSAAAESAVEMVTAQMERDFNFGSLTTAAYYASLPVNQSNWPVQYNFTDPTGTVAGVIHVYGAPPATNSQPLGSQYGGLYGFAWNWTVSAKATPILKSHFSDYVVPAIVTETNNFASIPIFQFAIFYNIDLEIDPGQAMAISGPVFCNKDIWAGGPNATFSSTVAAVGHVATTTTDTFANYPSPATSGHPTFSLAGQPTDNNPSLSMPIGTNNDPNAVHAILELPPAAYALGSSDAFTTNGQMYLANAADLFITNTANGINSATPSGTNTFVYYQDGSIPSSRQTLLPPDFYILKKTAPTGFYTNYVVTNLTAGADCVTNVQFAGYSFITNAIFYDWREGWSTSASKGKAVQAVQIDIAKFNTWLTNTATNSNSGAASSATCLLHKGHPIDSMYVYTGVPLTTTTLPAVRVVNGSMLPPNSQRSGFTLATQFPAYVYGDYNAKDTAGSAVGLFGTSTSTLHTYPAAIMADSVTILSTNWSDINFAKSPTPGNTTVNAAMLEGIVQSTNSTYSGGVENFMRLLEDWTAGGGKTLTYNGSIVVMFPSRYATNIWRATGNYYNAPTRHWSFDQNYAIGQSYLPPLTPETKALVRVQWMAK